MVRKSPCERYIKYLITHPDNYTDEDIKKLLSVQQLDYIGLPYIQNLRCICVRPAPFYPTDKTHRPSYQFIQKEELTELYFPDEGMKLANKLLNTAKAKEIIESLSITQANASWVCSALKKNGIPATSDAVKRYRWYYFDLSLVDSEELRQLMEIRGIPEPSTDPIEQKLNAALPKAHKMDSRTIMSRVATTPLAGMINIMRMGIVPNNMNVAKIARSARALATTHAYDSGIQGHSERMRDFSIAAKMLGEVLEQVGEVEEDLQEGLSRIALATDSREVPHLAALSDGEHTLDLLPHQIEDSGNVLDMIDDEQAELEEIDGQQHTESPTDAG